MCRGKTSSSLIDIHVIGVSQKGKGKGSVKEIFEEIMAKKFPNYESHKPTDQINEQ